MIVDGPDPRRDRAGDRRGALRATSSTTTTGSSQNASLMDYLVPTAAELPSVRAAAPRDAGARRRAYGVKGVGEGGTLGAAGGGRERGRATPSASSSTSCRSRPSASPGGWAQRERLGPLFERGPRSARSRPGIGSSAPGRRRRWPGPDGEVTDELVALYETLARNERRPDLHRASLLPTRAAATRRARRGSTPTQLVPGLRRLTDAVHRHGAKIFAQVAHAGSQSRIPDERAARAVARAERSSPAARSARRPRRRSRRRSTRSRRGARRAVEAGFDGVHIHGANGYLISEFSSPLDEPAHRPTAAAQRRRATRFALEVVRRVRAAVPADRAVTMKIGFVDAVPEGTRLELDESVPAGRTARRGRPRRGRGLLQRDAQGLPTRAPCTSPSTGAGPLADLLFHRSRSPGRSPRRTSARGRRRSGARSRRRSSSSAACAARETMERVLASGDADFVALARPFIREPDLVHRLAAGGGAQVPTAPRATSA